MALLERQGEAEFPYNKADVFQALKESVSTIGGMHIDRADETAGRLVIKTRISLTSWGETIRVAVTEMTQGRTKVSVTSSPKMGVVFGGTFDFGQNLLNIAIILEAMSMILSQKPPTKPSTSSVGSPVDPGQRMAKLKELCDQGLITKEDFEKKKAEILAEV